MIFSNYSIIEIYKKWKNGTPISEIVKITGIMRKTWNKRFERLEKKIKEATNSRSKIINENSSNLIIQNNGDRVENDTRNITKEKQHKLAHYLPFIIISIIGIALLAKWGIEKYKEWKMHKDHESKIN